MKKKAVIWESTVLYVLIGLAIIGTMLAVIRPKIAEMRDSILIEQTIQSLNIFDDKVTEVRSTTGNKGKIKIHIDKGNLILDSDNEEIMWQSISNYQYSDANKTIEVGKVKALTTSSAGLWNVTLKINYKNENIDFTIDGNDKVKKILSRASLPYTIWVTNNGTTGGLQQIDLIAE